MVCEGEHLRQCLLHHGDHFPIHGSSKVHKDSMGWREGEGEEERVREREHVKWESVPQCGRQH